MTRQAELFYKDGSYAERNPGWHVESSPWKAAQIISMMSKHGIQPATVCDVGCGAGVVLATLEAAWPATTFTGFDISPICLDLARQRETRRLKFVQGPVEGLFDMLLLLDVMEHVEDYFYMLRDLKTHAQYKLLHIPLDLSVHSLLRNVMGINRKQFGHIHYFTKDSALDALRTCGYEIIDWRYTAAVGDMRDDSLKGAISNLIRKAGLALSPQYGPLLFGGYSVLVLAK